MACVCSAWLRWGALLSAVFALCVQECVDKDRVLAEMSRDADLPTECVLSCTALTYRQILDGQQKLTVRFKDSQSGKSVGVCVCVCGDCDEALFSVHHLVRKTSNCMYRKWMMGDDNAAL